MRELIDAVWVAAESSSAPASLPGWVWALGSAAVTALGTILSGKIVVPTFAYNREKDRGDRLEVELRELRESTDKETIPALVRATDLNAKLAEELVRLRSRRGSS